MIYFPSAEFETDPQQLQIPHEEVWIPVAGGQLHGWWLPGAADRPTLLYLHGNAGNISHNLTKAAAFQSAGISVLLVDYRGYGRSSPPFPNETRFYEDAAAAWAYLRQRRGLRAEDIVIFGHSIGGAVAVELALRQPQAAGLVVEGSFTSMEAIARRDYGWVPLRWLLTERFDSLTKVPRLQIPVLFIHGMADGSVPADMSQQLYRAAPEPKQLWLVPGADHNDVLPVAGPEYLQQLRQFLQESTRTQR